METFQHEKCSNWGSVEITKGSARQTPIKYNAHCIMHRTFGTAGEPNKNRFKTTNQYQDLKSNNKNQQNVIAGLYITMTVYKYNKT